MQAVDLLVRYGKPLKLKKLLNLYLLKGLTYIGFFTGTRWRNQSKIVFNAANSHSKGALWGGSGDKMPCVRVAPGGWPLSNRWYLPAERAK